MHIFTDLITREGVFLVTLLALGSGPAALLSPRLDSVVRLTMAPALGMCVGVAVTVTLVQSEPVHSTYWVLYPVAALSLGVAGWRALRHRVSFRPPLMAVAQIVVVAIAVLGPPTLTLHSRATVGPVAFNVYDAAGYVAETDSVQTRSIDQASAVLPPYRNMAQGYWSNYARAYQNVDVAPLEASVNDILGLGSTDTQSPFMIVLLFVGALGAYGACRYALRSASWAAVLAGGLFGGAFFMQLWADSSQAAICGLALILPFIVVGVEALRERRVADHVVLGLISAGLLGVYPLFVPPMAIGSVIVLGILGVRQIRRRRPTPLQVADVAGRLLLIAVLAAVLSPVAFGRDLRYWQAILQGTLAFGGLPVYHLGVGILPAWLLQTRDFYNDPPLGHGGLKQVLLAVVVPLGMIGVIIAGFRWQRRVLILLPFAGMCMLLAEYVWVHNNCGYCVDRNLLPLGPLAAVMLAIGVGALFAMGNRLGRWAGVIAALVIVGAVAERTRFERVDILDTAYFLDSANRSVLSHLPHDGATVEVEGYGANIRGPGEMPLVYDLVQERTGGRASMVVDSTDYSSFAYLDGSDQPAAFNPRYGYVLTRFAGINAGRRVLARSGGIALEQRVNPLDVTPIADLGSPLARLDTSGVAWIQGGALGEPLLLWVAGGTPGPVWVHLDIVPNEAVAVPSQPGVTSRLTPGHLSVCIRASGMPPVRRATLLLSFTPSPGPPPHETYTLPTVAQGMTLTGMTAGTRRCRP